MSVRGVGAGLPAWESIWWDIWNSAKAGGQASYPTQMSGAAFSERVVEKLLTSRKRVEAENSTVSIGVSPLQGFRDRGCVGDSQKNPQLAAGKLIQKLSVA